VLAAARKARLRTRRIVVREPVDGELLRRWVADGVTAVVVEETDTGDLSAALFSALAAVGLSVPGDLSVAALGRPQKWPDVSGFEVPRRELGRRAVQVLVDQITASGPRVVDQVLLDCVPNPGNTLGPP